MCTFTVITEAYVFATLLRASVAFSSFLSTISVRHFSMIFTFSGTSKFSSF